MGGWGEDKPRASTSWKEEKEKDEPPSFVLTLQGGILQEQDVTWPPSPLPPSLPAPLRPGRVSVLNDGRSRLMQRVRYITLLFDGRGFRGR